MVLHAPPALAQLTPLPRAATPGDDDERVRVVRVQPKKRREAQHDDVTVRTVLPQAALRDTAPTLADALSMAGGLKIERAGGLGHAAQARIAASTTQQVTWALDDVPLRSPDGSPFDPADVPVSALSKAEIYQGGSPAALGGQAIGGAVRLVLRRPRTTGFNASLATGEYGSHLLDGAVGWRGLGGDGLLAVRGVLTGGDYPYLHDGGTLFDTNDDKARQRRNNDVRRASALLRQRFTALGWQWELRALAAVKEQGLPGLALYESLRSRLLTHRQDFVLAAAKRGVAMGGDRLSTGAYVGAQHTAVTDELGEQGIPLQLAQDVRTASGWLTWQGPARLALRPIVRLAVEHAGLSGEDKAQAATRPDVRQQQLDLTAGARWQLTEALQCTANANVARVLRDRYSLEPEAAHWAAVDAPNVTVGSGALSARWQAHPLLVLQAGARWGRRAPNLAELYGNSGTISGNPLLRDEQAISGELAMMGAMTLQQGRRRSWRTAPFAALGYSVSGFVRDATDLVALVRVSPARAVHRNIGASRTVGGDVRLWTRRAPVPGSGFVGSTFVQWGVTSAIDRGGDGRYAGKSLPFVPLSRWRIGYSAAVRIGWRWLHSVELVTGVAWRAGHFADRAATVVIPETLASNAALYARITERLRCGALAVTNDGFDVLGYPLPDRLAMLRCGYDAWGGAR